MRIYCLFILMLSIATNLLSQRKDLLLIPFELDGLWGYMNYEKKVILEPQFEEAYITNDLVGRIKKNGKYGYINNLGKVIVKPKYEFAEDFSCGIAKVGNGDQIRLINTEGKKYKPKYILNRCGHHRHFNLPIVVTDSLIAINSSYNSVEKKVLNSLINRVDTIYNIEDYFFIIVKKNKVAILGNISSRENPDSIINNVHYEYDDVKYFPCTCGNHGISNYIGIKKDNIWGYYDIADLPYQIIAPKYINIENFYNGLAKVEFESNRFGYIDTEANEYFYRSR